MSTRTSATVIANAWKSGGAEDDFRFEYAPDGSSWEVLFTVSSTGSNNTESAPLPLGIAGAIEIRVVDTDRTGKRTALDSVHVGQLVVRVQAAAGGTAPDMPTNLSASADLLVVGAYPAGQRWDLCYGKPEERPSVLHSIARVPLPSADPLYGAEGPLVEQWQPGV